MRIRRRHTIPYLHYQWHWQPLVPTLLSNGPLSTPTMAVLDSGADECLFSATLGEDIGLKVANGRPGKLHGIVADRPAEVFYHLVNIEIGAGIKFRCEVAFSYDVGEEWPDQLIGRSGIFPGLEITFRERRRRMHLIEE